MNGFGFEFAMSKNPKNQRERIRKREAEYKYQYSLPSLFKWKQNSKQVYHNSAVNEVIQSYERLLYEPAFPWPTF